MLIEKHMRIDFAQRGLCQQVFVVQGDCLSRSITFSLYENGRPWELPSGVTPALRYGKSDGTGGVYDTLPDGNAAWTAAGNEVGMLLAPQVMTMPGLVQCQLMLVKEDAILGSFSFHLIVEPDPAYDAVESKGYFNWSKVVGNLIMAPQAEVGQIIRVKTVDGEGHPTEWEAVDLPDSSQNGDYVKTVNGIEPDENGNVDTAAPTDEQVTQAVESWLVKNPEVTNPTDEQVAASVATYLDEHPEATTTVQDGSVTWGKIAPEVLNNESSIEAITELTFTRIYADIPGYYGGAGSYGTQYIDISKAKKIHAESTVSSVVWYSYELDGEKVYVYDSAEIKRVIGGIWTKAPAIMIDGKYVFDMELDELRANGIEAISIGFHGKNFDATAQSVSLILYEARSEMEKVGITETIDKLIDTNYKIDSGYSGVLFDVYGTNKAWFKGNAEDGYIDVSQNKEIYLKIPKGNAVAGASVGFGCFNENKELLYLTTSDMSEVEIMSQTETLNVNGLGTSPDGNNIMSVVIYKVSFPETVKYASFVPAISTHASAPLWTDSLFVAGYKPIADIWLTDEEYRSGVTDEFRKIVEEIAGANTAEVVSGVFIGDSLTDWGGGDDANDGFLKIVHDKTGMLTSNEGAAGAWWQADSSQTYSAVARVDAIVSDGRKYDLYCFLMGTNAGANTDTGETSADPSTMPGAIRYCLETLKAYDPTAKILVCLPPQRAEGNANQEKVNDVIKAISESYSVKTLDIYHHGGIVPNTVVADSNYLSDGLHLGENGYKALGDMLAAEIKYMFCL